MQTETKNAPKFRIIRGLTHRVMRLSPAYGIQLVYQDDPQQYVANRYVLYWQYNENEDGLNYLKDDERYWQRENVIMPVGLGLTNEKGELIAIQRVPGLDLSKIDIKQTDNRSIHYQRPTYTNAQTIRERTAHTQAEFGNHNRTVTRFTCNKTVAFMLLPVDNPHIKTLTTEDLISLGKQSPMVWKGKLTKDNQRIEIPCPLEEWDMRLQNQIRPLEEAVERYQKIITPHLQEIAKLENLRHYQQILYRYPMEKALRDEPGNKTLITRIKDLQKVIAEQYINNTDQALPCGKALDDIRQQGEKLYALLNQPALLNEIKRYLPYLKDAGVKNQPTIMGADGQQESDWRLIYDTLIKAYGLLAATNLAEVVYDEHVTPMLNYILALADDLQAEDGIDEAFIRHYNDAKNNAVDSKDTLLLVVLSEWMKNTYGNVANSPGPPSLGMATLNAFGVYITRGFDPEHHRAAAAKSLRLLFGLMKVANLGIPLSDEERRRHITTLKAKDIAGGRIKISDFLQDLSFHRRMKYFTPIFKSLMLVYAIGTFQHAYQAETLNTWSEWSRMLTASADTGMAGMGVGSAIVRLFNVSWAEGFATSVEMIGRFLGVVASVATMISSGITAVDRWRKEDFFAGTVSAISSLSAAAVTIGYLLGYIMIGTAAVFWTWMLAAALVVAFFEPIVLFFRDAFLESSEKTFMAILSDLQDNIEGQFHKNYTDNSVIMNAKSALETAANRLKWWRMSWRAIIPLYESGIVNYQGAGKINTLTTARVIGQAIDIPMPKSRLERRNFHKINIIVKYLDQYEDIKEGEKRGDSVCGNSISDWLQGIALPYELPAPIYDESL